MFLGLASWILDNFLKNMEDEKLKRFYESIQATQPSTLEEFSDIFLKTHNYEVEDFWGWGWWELKFEGRSSPFNFWKKWKHFTRSSHFLC